MIQHPTPIYHITHVDNLPGIIADGGIRCCVELRQAGVGYRDIAYGHIQDRRARKPVSCGPRGMLHDYVPFNFAPRSPMLFTINRGNVATYTDGQQPVVHLVSNVQAIQDAGYQFVFTDGHATMMTSAFYDDLLRLDTIDWPLMRSRYWNDTNQYPDLERRRQAEFLVHRFFPVSFLGSLSARSV